MAKSPEKRRFYGSITVSDRGQIVIPAEARRDFGIEVGDKLLVLGDLDQGLALVKASAFLERFPGLLQVFPDEAGENGHAANGEATE
ncbi:MAG: AbrB/MazE/SpoVT family DNA-binding domain-containing protein [Chloroflexota bacterium]